MTGFEVKVTGTAELAAALDQLGADLGNYPAALDRVSRRGAALARGFAPRRTGALAGSITPGTSRGRAFIQAGRGRVNYAGFRNYGTRRMAGSFFLQRADDALVPVAVKELDRATTEAINRRKLQ